MPRAEVNGVEIYYESHGEGPPVVFAHGRAGSHLSWWRQVPAFRDQYRCITFDARGWGTSTSQPGVNRRDAFGEDLNQLLDYLEVPQVYLVSQSMGGLTCMDFALGHPERCLGLVLGDTTGGVGDPAVLGELQDVFPPPDGPARTMCPGFIANNPRAGIPARPDRWSQLHRPPGRHRRRIQGPQRSKGRGPSSPDHAYADDCGRGRSHLSAPGHRSVAEVDPRLGNAGGIRRGPLGPLRAAGDLQPAGPGLLRQDCRGQTRGCRRLVERRKPGASLGLAPGFRTITPTLAAPV